MSNNVTLIPKKPARHTLLTDTDYVVYMPLASKNTHGIVKVGDGLAVSVDGLLSVDFKSPWYSSIESDVEQLKVDVDAVERTVDELELDVSEFEDRLTGLENGTKLIPVYQTKQDSGLVTVNKTVVGGINELKNHTQLNANTIQTVVDDVRDVKSNYATLTYVNNLYSTVSMGGHKSIVFDTKDDFLAWSTGDYIRADSLVPDNLHVGDMVLIKEKGVPDYWVSSKSKPMTIDDFAEYEAKIDVPEVKVDAISITKNENGELQAIAIKNGRLIVGDTISRSDFKGWIELENAEQFRNLVEYGSVLVGDEIINYDENAVYVTPELDSFDVQEQLDAIASSIDMKADRAVVDKNTIDIVDLQTTVTELSPKVMRALVTPMTRPNATEIVAIDDGNSQVMIEIGDGLSLENGVLKANGGDKILLFTNDESNVHTATIDATNIASGDILEVQFMGSEVVTTRFRYSMLTTDFKMSSSFVDSNGKLITNTQYFIISKSDNTLAITYTHYNHFVNENGNVTSTTNNSPSSAQWIRRIYKVVD